MRKCSVTGCEKKHLAKGFCRAHYGKFKNYGDPLAGQTHYSNPEDALMARSIRRTNGCHEWTGATTPDGYGMIKVSGVGRPAHRVAYELKYGEIPKGMFACHTCDNPSCVNPDHIFIGTPQDNVDDMVAKGRGRKASGEGHGRALISEDDVRAIRSDVRSARVVASQYGISRSAVWSIKNGVNWGHVV